MKKGITFLLVVVMLCSNLFAHSGRTDSNGGHKDNKNVSGLGSYHYHCGGYPAHLHDNGVCPYDEVTYINSASKEKTTYTEKKVGFTINNKNSTIDAINVNGTNLIELRTLCDQLGITIVEYDSELKSIKCIKGTDEFILQIDSKNMWKNGELILIDVPPVAYKGRTMVPVRVVAEAIGKSVTYDSSTGNIVIK
nr:copper amine oxidase N-terminal domain-containing protein [uncultured Cellulosilyticum sp.]